MGLSTCYGTIGEPVLPDSWRTEWAAIAGTPQVETPDPQREQLPLGCGVDAERWDAFMGKTDRRELRGVSVTHSGGNWQGLDYVYVTGSRQARERVIALLRSRWREYVRSEAMAFLRRLYDRSGFELPKSLGGVACGQHFPPDLYGYGERALLQDLIQDPMEKLTQAERQLVERTAEAILGTDPAEVASRCVYGTAGHISVTASKYAGVDTTGCTELWRHILEQPGVGDWYREVSRLAPAAKVR